MLTTAGRDFVAAQIGGTATTATAQYMAITTDAAAASAADTTLASEETTNGLGRLVGTYAHSTSTATYTITRLFTYSGSSSKVIAKVGLFTAASAGTLVFETVLGTTATLSASGDTLTITQTVTLS